MEIEDIQKVVYNAFLEEGFLDKQYQKDYSKKYYIYLIRKIKGWSFERIGRHLNISKVGASIHYKDFLKFLEEEDNKKYRYISKDRPIDIFRDVLNIVTIRLDTNFLKHTITNPKEKRELNIGLDRIIKIINDLKNEKL